MLQGSLVVGGISSGALAATRVPVALCLGAGLVLGLLAVASAIYLEPLLARHLRTPQPYLSLSVHGLPALLGGLLGVALAAVSEEKAGLLNYSISLYTLYPGRAPPAGWTCVTNKTVAEILLCPSSGDQVTPPRPAPPYHCTVSRSAPCSTPTCPPATGARCSRRGCRRPPPPPRCYWGWPGDLTPAHCPVFSLCLLAAG